MPFLSLFYLNLFLCLYSLILKFLVGLLRKLCRIYAANESTMKPQIRRQLPLYKFKSTHTRTHIFAHKNRPKTQEDSIQKRKHATCGMQQQQKKTVLPLISERVKFMPMCLRLPLEFLMSACATQRPHPQAK